MKYGVIRTDTADALIREIILYIEENFGDSMALKKLDELEEAILSLEDNPYIGTTPKYNVLKRQGYMVLIFEKILSFIKSMKRKRWLLYMQCLNRDKIIWASYGDYKMLIFIKEDG